MAISFIDVYRAIGKTQTDIAKTITQITHLVQTLLASKQDMLSFFLDNKEEIAHLRGILHAYLWTNQHGNVSQEDILETLFCGNSYQELKQCLAYAIPCVERIGKGIEKRCKQLNLNLPETIEESEVFFEKLIAPTQVNIYAQYVHYALERDFYFLVIGVIDAQNLQPTPLKIKELTERILANIRFEVNLAQSLGWLPKPKKQTYQPITEEELNDKTLKGWAKIKRDTEVINAYIREGKDIKQLEEVLNVKFG
jgi:hypothetical protein